MMYLGHDTCTCHRDVNGITDIEECLIVIEHYDEQNRSEEYKYNEYIRIVAHEIGHLFDAPDHYGTGTSDTPTTAEMNAMYDTENFSNDCIYGTRRSASGIAENLTICQGCCDIILENANRFFGVDP